MRAGQPARLRAPRGEREQRGCSRRAPSAAARAAHQAACAALREGGSRSGRRAGQARARKERGGRSLRRRCRRAARLEAGYAVRLLLPPSPSTALPPSHSRPLPCSLPLGQASGSAGRPGSSAEHGGQLDPGKADAGVGGRRPPVQYALRESSWGRLKSGSWRASRESQGRNSIRKVRRSTTSRELRLEKIDSTPPRI